MNFGECEDQSDKSLPILLDVLFRCHSSGKLQAQNNVFSHVAGFASWQDLDLSGNGPATMVRNLFVSGDYFPTLGVRAYKGRLFDANDDRPEAPAGGCAELRLLATGRFGELTIGHRQDHQTEWQSRSRSSELQSREFDALTLANKYDLWTPLARRP